MLRSEIPEDVQILLPSDHTILPVPFERHTFHEGLISTRSPNGNESVSAHPSKPFIVVHPDFLDVLGPKPSFKLLARQDRPFAHEAGIYEPSKDDVWFTSNLFRDKDDVCVEVSKINLTTSKVERVEIPHVGLGNGGCLYQKKLLFCEQGSLDSPSQLVLVDPSNPSEAQPILNNFHGRQFNSLNDVITLPNPAGPGLETIWFTDPCYGYEQGYRPKPQLPSHVYVFDPRSGEVRTVADGFDHPNGICFSPKGDICYITDTGHIHGTGVIDPTQTSTIYAFEVAWQQHKGRSLPTLRNRRVFAFADSGVPDGIKCDTEGNVYSGCGDGIHVWNPLGQLIGKIVFKLADLGGSGGCANFCFVPGGRLCCFAEHSIYLIEGLNVEGATI